MNMKIIERIKGMGRARKVIWSIGIVLALLVLWRAGQRILGTGSGGPNGKTAVAVEISHVETGPIRDLGRFSGTLIPKSRFDVAPKVSGKLKKLYVNIGDRVSQGQVVAQLDDEEYRHQVTRAEAELRVARANLDEARSALDLARRDLDRAETLHAKGILSDSELDASRARFGAREAASKVAEAQIANQEAALETARIRLSYTRIEASWQSGNTLRYVGERHVDEGGLLAANTPIISIVELQPITAVIHAPEKDYFRVRTGQDVAITSAVFPDARFAGRVVRMAPLLRETSRQARVEVDIDNEDGRLKPGMFINAEIEYARRDDARIVPFSAIVSRQDVQGIFMADLDAGKAVFRRVRIGVVEDDKAEVLEPAGLSGFVVVLGQHLLEDGMGIILPASAAGPAAIPGSAKRAR